MKKFSIIAFDIDGTLTESKSPLEESPATDTDMSDLLGKLLKSYKVAIISGAAFKQFESQILSHLGEDKELLKNLYLLPTNGASLCTYEDAWRCSVQNALTEEEKQEISQAFSKALSNASFEMPGQVFGEVLEDRGTQMTFSALGQQAPLELKRAWDPEHKKRAELVTLLKGLLPEFTPHIGGSTSVDVTRKGVDKASGLSILLEYLNLPKEKMLYVGDELRPDGNDEPALRLGLECKAVTGPDDTKKLITLLLAQ